MKTVMPAIRGLNDDSMKRSCVMKQISRHLVICTTILTLLLTACASTDPSRLVIKPKAITQVDELLTKMTGDGTFTGSVLIAQDGQVLLTKGYGLADRAQGIPNTPQTRFPLGSVSKQFTALAILILQSQDKLSVQDPICNFIADCPAAWLDITIHHLLTHTSGLSSGASSRLYSIIETAAGDPAMPSDPAYFLGLARELPLDTRPGERYAYNNAGYVLLAHIIEQVSGQSYGAFLRQAIFSPLNMHSTGYQDSSSGVALCYNNRYTTRGGGLWPKAMSDGAGGLYSTSEDLFLWDQALYTDQLLPRSELQRMFEPYVPDTGDDPGFAYGYGWGVWEDRGRPVVLHTGGGSALATLIMRYPEDGLTLIVLMNQGPFDPSIFTAISNALFGEPPPTTMVTKEPIV